MNEGNPLHILLVEDNPGDARLIQEMLKEVFQKICIHHVYQLADVKSLSEEKYNLILLDLNLPDSSGLSTVVRMHELLPSTPIVVMTGLDNEELSLSAIQSGAQDYLVKNKTDFQQLFKTIQYAIHRYQIFKEINELSDAQKAYLASHDVLTGLPSQQLFLETLQLKINTHRITKKKLALFLLEFHEMDKIISKFGHSEKDKLLKEISVVLTTLFPQSVVISRYNENTFALLYSELPNTTGLSKIFSLIKHAFAQSILINDHEYFPSNNIGMAVFPFDGQDPEKLIKSAHIALKNTLQSGGQKYEVFKEKLPFLCKHNETIILHSDLQAALARQEFFIVYQPQIHISSQKVIGVEALLRWKHPKLGIILPEKFIPIAEEDQLISSIGEWVLEAVAQQYEKWQNDQLSKKLLLHISVNVSTQQLISNCLFSTVRKIIKERKIIPEYLELELTESIFIDRPEYVIEKLNQLKHLGIKLAIDDFGKGYSSLSYLSHLPIDRLKLDMTFIQKNQSHTSTSIIVKSVINLAHNLQLRVIAEGVETKEQLITLKNQKCDDVQGDYFSKPVSARNITEIISNNYSIKNN